MAEWTDSRGLFQRNRAQEWKALSPVSVLSLGTSNSVWSHWTGRNRCGKHGVKINRLFFTQGFVGQQIDLKKSKPYWQPMKETKHWNTASKWRRLCHQVGQLILYTLKPSEVNVSNTIQKWFAIIKTTEHESSSEQFNTIQIKVTANTPQIPHMVKGVRVQTADICERKVKF